MSVLPLGRLTVTQLQGWYAPISIKNYASSDNTFFTSRVARELHVLATLKPGVTIQQAQTGLQVIASRLSEQSPETNHGQTVRVFPEKIARPDPDSADPCRPSPPSSSRSSA